MKTLSIRQPYAQAIVLGHKDIENRDWTTSHRGPILIHAGKKIDADGYTAICNILGIEVADALLRKSVPLIGGIVGIADLVDVITESDSPWFLGKYGWVLKNARPIVFIPCRGQLMLFDVPDTLLITEIK